ncbi:uncharacterized protein TrAtP1_007364 [Trichoderma atroviride]|uniref:uncharacterized protein n=1 Tax=Hypocrea atroviridis TaxID=63577 RepID=UPI00331A1276|nr:hypothetical protein TrAtP1_007364 [Trichoderma atroviride]
MQTSRSLINWFRLQHLVFIGWADLLGEEQRNSYRLLFDWWTAASDRHSTPLSYCSQLQSLVHQNPRSKRFTDDYEELWICIQNSLLETLSDLQSREAGHSDYDKALYQLFMAEFADFRTCIDEAREDYSLLRAQRIHAAREAYYRQASLHCSQISHGSSDIRHGSFGPILAGRNGTGFTHECSWARPVEASDPYCPQTLDCGPRIAACPWLEDKHEDPFGLGGWPEYLWHLNDRCLVRTRDLGPKRPAYTAISHTWGRWMSENDGYLIPNGMKYRVPHNAMFDIKSLPQSLQHLGTKIDTDYAWLDLVCIPQGCKGEALDEEHDILKRQEISRQGSIFRNAKRAIAWFHDVDDFSCLGGLMEFAALSRIGIGETLTRESQHERERRMARALTKMEDGLAELFSKPEDTPKGPGFQQWSKQQMGHGEEMSQPINFWFTSLWTLQELCLRPDMWLATSDWKFLCLQGNTRIPLNGALCILQKYEKSLTPGSITERRLLDAI